VDRWHDPDLVDRVKVRYELTPDEDGWPPVTAEELWAVRLSADVVRVDNVPWFVPGLALDDLVQVCDDGADVLRPVVKLRWSGNCTIRVLSLDKERDPLARMQALIDKFTPLGARGEATGQFGIVAFNVPPDADITAVKQLLVQGQLKGWWEYEEGCVGGAWDE
jgi:hypothetical protein